MQRPSSQHPTFIPGARLSRRPVAAGESLEDFYRDLFANTGPEHDRERLLCLLDADVADGAAAQGRAKALDHLNQAFRRIDAWTCQGDYLPQADRAELKRRVAHNLLAARPGLDLAARDTPGTPSGPDRALLRQVQAEHTAWRQGWALSGPAGNATGTHGQNGTSPSNSTSGPLDETLQDIFGQDGEEPGPLDNDLENEFDLKGAKTYWTVQPEPTACEKCQAMAGKVFTKEPERPHPNCKCLIQKHKIRVYEKTIKGKLCGFDDFSIERFTGGRNVKVTVSNEGPFAAIGIHVMSNTGQNQGSMILRGLPVTFYFTTPESTPFDWKIMFLVRGGDNSCLNYTITYHIIEK